MSGDVRVEVAGRSNALTANQRVESGSTVLTGVNGQAVLRFDDGQVAALANNSTFKIDKFQFEAAKPEKGSVAVSLLKGALRMITGLIGERNRSNFALQTPNATIGIRGTDFMVGIVNPVYVTVIGGGVTATNAAGMASWAAGSTGMIASPTALGVGIAAGALPAGVSASFAQLSGLQMVGAAGMGGISGTPAGASGATAAATGGLSVGAAAAAGAIAAGVIAATSSNSSATGTTGTTGTTAPLAQ